MLLDLTALSRGLGSPPTHWGSGTLDDALDRQAIQSAVNHAAEHLKVGGGPWRPGACAGIVAFAARRLVRAGLDAEAIHVTRAAADYVAHTDQIVMIRSQALLRLGRGEELIRDLELAQGSGLRETPAVRIPESLLRSPTSTSLLAFPFAHHEPIWGPILPDVRHKLAALRQERLETKLNGATVEALHALQADRMGLDEFRDRLGFGKLASWYLSFLMQCRGRMDATTPSEMRAAILALSVQVQDVTPIRGAELVERREREGRSIVFALSHSGVTLPAQPSGRTSGLPRSIVSVSAPANLPGQFHVSTASGGATMQFLSLIKAMRKAPRLVTIVPDGGFGETQEIEVLKRLVPVGKGAAILAHRGSAAVFGARSRWTGHEFEIEILEGPVADGQGRESFERDFYDFYRAHLEDVLLGPPEDIAPTGGIIPAFIKASMPAP